MGWCKDAMFHDREAFYPMPPKRQANMMQVISGTCYEHGPWTGPNMCPKCPKMTVSYPPTYDEGYAAGFRAGAEAMREAAAKHIEAGHADCGWTTAQLVGARTLIAEVIRDMALPEPPK